jgi:ABC-type transporter Mla subunit MlaD
MNPQLKRIFGIVLVIISIVSLIISAGGVIGLWGARPAITTALEDTFALVSETAVTTQQALNVADQALQDAAGSIKILTGLTDTLADSLGGAQGAFTSVTQLLTQDLPVTLETAQTALDSAAEPATVVDNFLSGLAKIQFLGIDYNPEVPLDQSISNIGDSLNSLPATLEKIGSDLDGISSSLPDIVKAVRSLGTTIGDITTTLAKAQTVLKEYAVQLARASAAVQQISAGVPTYVTLFISVLTFIMLWIIAVQLIVLAIGLRWLKSA